MQDICPPGREGNLFTVIAQDPTVKRNERILTAKVQVPRTELRPGPRSPRFHVIDYDATTKRFEPPAPIESGLDLFADVDDETLLTSAAFHAQHVYAVAARTLARFEFALGRRLPWGFAGHQLHLVPHAFCEANAYYSDDDRALLFGYLPPAGAEHGTGDGAEPNAAAPGAAGTGGPVGNATEAPAEGVVDGNTIYTCLSHDVVAHETTHAVLDGLRTRYMEPGLPDQAAFHEGFADVVAILSVFSTPGVVEFALDRAPESPATGPAVGGAGGDGAGDGSATASPAPEGTGPDAPDPAVVPVRERVPVEMVGAESLRKSVLFGVAEQVGKALTHGRGALRQSSLTAPAREWLTNPAYREPHRRGEILVSIVLDVLIRMWVERLRPYTDPDGQRQPETIDRAWAAEEGAKAADHLLTMLIRGLDYLPPAEFEFEDLLDAVYLADVEVAPDDTLKYRESLTASFKAAGICRPPTEVHSLIGDGNGPDYRGLNFASLRSDADEVYRFIWQNADVLGIDLDPYTHVEAVRPSQRVGPDGLIVAETVTHYVQMLDLSASELVHNAAEAAAGTGSTVADVPTDPDCPPRPTVPAVLPSGVDADTPVQVIGGGTLVFDQFGRAKFHFYKELSDWNRQMRRLNYLAVTGVRDRKDRIGYSAGAGKGQAFAALHGTSDSDQDW